MKITAHFTAAELTTTLTGIANYPNLGNTWCNLTRLCCTVLEPLRALVGPLRVNSGYRCEAVNAAVGGSSNSAHLYGRAAVICIAGHEDVGAGDRGDLPGAGRCLAAAEIEGAGGAARQREGKPRCVWHAPVLCWGSLART